MHCTIQVGEGCYEKSATFFIAPLSHLLLEPPYSRRYVLKTLDKIWRPWYYEYVVQMFKTTKYAFPNPHSFSYIILFCGRVFPLSLSRPPFGGKTLTPSHKQATMSKRNNSWVYLPICLLACLHPNREKRTFIRHESNSMGVYRLYHSRAYSYLGLVGISRETDADENHE